MLKGASVIAGGALVVAVMAIAVSGPAATAAAPDCKNKANPYVACTGRLKAKTVRKRSGFDRFLEIGSIKGETEDRRRRGPRLRTR
jgi:hypothetical protein